MAHHAPRSWGIRLFSGTASLYLWMGLGVVKSLSPVLPVHDFYQQKNVTVAREGYVEVGRRAKVSENVGKVCEIFQGKGMSFFQLMERRQHLMVYSFEFSKLSSKDSLFLHWRDISS